MRSASNFRFSRWSNAKPLQNTEIPKAIYFLVITFFFENVALYGILDFHHEVYGEFIHKEITVYANYELLTNFCGEFAMLFISFFADAYLSKFWLILILAIPQSVGIVIIFLSSYTLESLSFMYSIGYAFYIFGKTRLPIILSFGADQLEKSASKELFLFFTLFAYCMGKFVQGCFLPHVYKIDDISVIYFYCLLAGAAVLSNISLLMGVKTYRRFPTSTASLKFWHCILYALFKKLTSAVKCHHWLYYAKNKFNEDLIAHVRRQLHLMFILVVILVFSALYNSLNYLWSLQAEQMEPLIANVLLQPRDLMSLAGIIPALLTPVFAFIIFPNFKENSALSSHIRRIIFAGFLACCAFIMSGFLQIMVEARLPTKPYSDETSLYIYNPLPCKITVMFTNYKVVDISPLGKYEELQIRVKNAGLKEVRLKEEYPCKHLAHHQNLSWSPVGGESYALIFSFANDKNTLLTFKFGVEKFNWVTSEKGKVNIRLLYTYDPRGFKVEKIILIDKQRHREFTFPTPSNFGITRYARIKDAKYAVCAVAKKERLCAPKLLMFHDHYVFNIVITSWLSNDTIEAIPFVSETANITNIIYQIPQYAVLACSEILLYVSMIDFVYIEAIEGTSCTVLSICFMYYFTANSVNSILRLLVSLANPKSIVFFHMLFAIFLFVVILIFAICSASYKTKEDLDEDIEVVHNILNQIEKTRKRRLSAPY